MIAEITWNQLHEDTIHWFCCQYDVCALEDFKTISALPDLLKHEPRFIKYFDLHFYNNLSDNPPSFCIISVKEAFVQSQPNLLKAVKSLFEKFQNVNSELSLTEVAYFIHLLADLHQPFHCNRHRLCT